MIKNKSSSSQIIVALDGMSAVKALQVARELRGLVWGFKVTDLLYEDVAIIDKLKKFGNVFADAKLYDIPNTVSNSTLKLSKAGADFITVHASGGIEMMRAAKRSAGKSKIIAVTVLTSTGGSVEKEVARLARDVVRAGVDGVVCSGRELKLLSAVKNSQLLLKIVPGIRPSWYGKNDDQVRNVTPKEAVRWGADFLVIGRPITTPSSAIEATKQILAEIAQ